MGILSAENVNRAVDSEGQIVPRALRYVYRAGTDKLSQIFEDTDLTNLQANPSRANEDGEFDLCFLMEGLYRVEIRTTAGKVLAEVEDILIRGRQTTSRISEFSSVEDLMSDVILGYGDEGGKLTVVAGDVLRVADGNFVYCVAPEGDLAPHLVTAGGINLHVQSLKTPVNVQQFGILPGNFDNSQRLRTLRDTLIAKDRGKHWVLLFPEGRYDYVDNRWLNGLLRITIDGYGAQLRCIGDGTFSGDSWPFGPREAMFRATGTRLVGDVGFAVDLGDRIETAITGAAELTLLDVADADAYSVGDRVFFYSMAQGNIGYTPNSRYFEWNEVISKSGAVLTLRFPVQHDHLADYPDFLYLAERTIDGTTFPDQYIGKPRILNLSGRPQTDGSEYWYPELIHVKGVRFPANPNTTTSYRVVLAGRKVLWEDVVVDPETTSTMGFDLREGELSKAVRCKADTIEVDKLLNHTEIEGCELGDKGGTSIIGGSSTKTLSVRNTHGRAIMAASATDGVLVESCQFSSVGRADNAFNGPIMPGYPGGTGALRAIIQNNAFLGHEQQGEIGLNVLVKTATVDGVDASDGTLTAVYDAAHPPDFAGLLPGRRIWIADAPRIVGIVHDFIHDGDVVKVRFRSGNLPESIKSGHLTGPLEYAWSPNDAVILNGEVWNSRARFEDVNTGLLNWGTFRATAGYDIQGATLAGNGTGSITSSGGTGFVGILNGNQVYRLTYDADITSGNVILRDGSSGSNLAMINVALAGTGMSITFQTSANGQDLELRSSSFLGSFHPLNLERL